MSFVSKDAAPDERRGLVFQAHINLDKAAIRVDEHEVMLSPGVAVIAEIGTGKRSVMEFFLDPIRKIIDEGLESDDQYEQLTATQRYEYTNPDG